MKGFSRYFRLLPAVILLGGGLLVMKSISLVEDARAQTAMTGQAPAPQPKDTTQVAVSDPVIDDSEANSAAEIDVLTSLSKRRQQLDAREKSLTMQSDLIAAAEQRVDGKIAMLKQLQVQLQELLGQRDAAEQKQLNDLVKTYSSMKPADAARIFDTLDDTVELNVAAQMKADVLGAILAKMQPDAAEKLTVRLANRLKVPDAAPALAAAAAPEPAQQMTPVDPAAQTADKAAAGTPTAAAPTNAQPPETAPKQAANAPKDTAAPKQATNIPAPTSPAAPAKPQATPAAQSKPQATQTKPAPEPAKQAATAAPVGKGG